MCRRKIFYIFLHNSTAITSKTIFDAQMSPTIPQSTTVSLTINASSNRILDIEIKTIESVDYSNISHYK